MDQKRTTVEMRKVTDTNELAKALKQRGQFDYNSAWLQNNISEIYARYRSKCICVAGQELFVPTSMKGAIAQAMAAHPDGQGGFTRYIPKEKVARIYTV